MQSENLMGEYDRRMYWENVMGEYDERMYWENVMRNRCRIKKQNIRLIKRKWSGRMRCENAM